MKHSMRTSVMFAALLVSGSATAVDVYKCTSRDGDVRFQDKPCARDEASQSIRLVDDPPPPSVPVAPVDVRPAADSAPAIARDVSPAAPAPSAYLCTRDDGSRYLSSSGVGERRAVPLAMLGIPGKGLAEAYGPGGAGISAPGVRAPSSDRSLHGSLGAAYVWVEDTCAHVSGAQLCAFLSSEIEAAERRLRYAFSDTTAQVNADIAALRVRAAGCGR